MLLYACYTWTAFYNNPFYYKRRKLIKRAERKFYFRLTTWPYKRTFQMLPLNVSISVSLYLSATKQISKHSLNLLYEQWELCTFDTKEKSYELRNIYKGIENLPKKGLSMWRTYNIKLLPWLKECNFHVQNPKSWSGIWFSKLTADSYILYFANIVEVQRLHNYITENFVFNWRSVTFTNHWRT